MPDNENHALPANHYIKVNGMIEEKVAPIKEDIKSMKTSITQIKTVGSFLKWLIPLGMAGTVALSSLIAGLIVKLL